MLLVAEQIAAGVLAIWPSLLGYFSLLDCFLAVWVFSVLPPPLVALHSMWDVSSLTRD